MAGGHAQPEAIAQPEEAAEAQIVLGGDCAPTLHNRMNAALGTSDGEGQAVSADPHGSQNLLQQHLAGWAIHRQPSRCADWLQQARADLDLPAEAAAGLAEAVPDLEERLRILDALCIPTQYPDSLPDGAPADHFGRLQSADALLHARSIVDAIAAALA